MKIGDIVQFKDPDYNFGNVRFGKRRFRIIQVGHDYVSVVAARDFKMPKYVNREGVPLSFNFCFSSGYGVMKKELIDSFMLAVGDAIDGKRR